MGSDVPGIVKAGTDVINHSDPWHTRIKIDTYKNTHYVCQMSPLTLFLYHTPTFVCLFQSALFNFQSLLTVVLLLICTCAYIRALAPRMLDKNKEGYVNIRMFNT